MAKPPVIGGEGRYERADEVLRDNALDKQPENTWIPWLLGGIFSQVFALSIKFLWVISDGFPIFIVLPAFSGFFTGLVLGKRGIGSKNLLFTASIIYCGLCAVFCLVTMIEGLICLMMASPLLFGFNYLGLVLGYKVFGGGDRNRHRARPMMAVAMLIPLLWWVQEARLTPDELVLKTTTSIVIDASPEEVWEYVPEPGDLPESEYFLFKAGVAHPLTSKIYGKEVGALRICELSTGSMPEVIEVYEPGRQLDFRVLETPASMKELNPLWPGTAPTHLHGMFEVLRGRFELVPLEGGRTKLVGTTWSVNRLQPVAYWQTWSDEIVHQVHREVLTQIKKKVEGGRSGVPGASHLSRAE